MKEVRRRKIESLLREEIASMIVNSEVKDPRIDKLLSVTDVSISRDFQYAKVYISLYGEKEKQERAVELLNHASGFIQGRLGKRIRLKATPKLTFLFDDSIERGFRITRALKDLTP